jgi:hypothetical protein
MSKSVKIKIYTCKTMAKPDVVCGSGTLAVVCGSGTLAVVCGSGTPAVGEIDMKRLSIWERKILRKI